MQVLPEAKLLCDLHFWGKILNLEEKKKLNKKEKAAN